MSSNKIAIIGMACHFPGAKTPDQFWRNLRDGVESIRFFSKAELLTAGVDPALVNSPNYVRANAVLDDIELFAADFFGMTPREAEITDPQHRLFLTCAWEALEDAGYDPSQIPGWAGVYAGAGMSSYLLYNLAPQRDELPVTNFQLLMGNNKDFVPTRVSYRLNLKGPSVNINSACSTSLVAVHMACQGLLDFECDVALAGGAGIQVPQKSGYLYEDGGIVSADGHCRPFDAKGNGTVNGSGAGIVVLKRLDDALADGDTVYGVILGSAINNDGSDKVGFTAPSVSGQAKVIAEAQEKAEIHPDEISYIEAHGTATALGDPIEIRALSQVFRDKTDRVGYCAIGSVKSNFGHLDEAAGVAGLIKTVLALRHKQIPPSLHFETPNPRLNLESSAFFVNQTLRDWVSEGDSPRRAGVSSFGIGGTNAHLIVEEPNRPAVENIERCSELLTVSARTEAGLKRAVANLIKHLQEKPEQSLHDVAFTLALGRKEFGYRQAAAGDNRQALLAALKNGRPCKTETADVVFMFLGQGGQYVHMAERLYRSELVFRQVLDECEAILRPVLGQSLFEIISTNKGDLLSKTAIAQPVLFAVEYALAQLLMSWGIRPVALIGHSLGEFVAACVAGVFSLQDGLLLVAERGRLMQSCAAGAMLAVRQNETAIQPYLGLNVALAAVNGADQCVVSGETEAIETLEQRLKADGVVCGRLVTEHAFHSHLMDPILDSFARLVGQIRLNAPQIPLVSNVTGGWLTAAEAMSAAYWTAHLRQPVRFEAGIKTIVATQHSVLLEIGPGDTLAKLGKANGAKLVLSSLPRQNQAGKIDDQLFVRQMLGQLWAHGVAVDWDAFYGEQTGRRISLPTYPFEAEAQRYWIDPPRYEGKIVKPIIKEAEEKAKEKAKEVNSLALDRWFYTPQWEHDPLIQTSGFKFDGVWLLLGDNFGTAELLMGQGAQVVSGGCRFEYAEVERLLRGLADRPTHIVHFGGVGETGSWEAHFFDWLYLMQGLDNLGWTDNVTLTAVTTGMQAVQADDLIDPNKAVLNGPLRVIPLEYPGVMCRQVDFDQFNAGLLLAEWGNGVEPAVAYRDSKRFVPTLKQVVLPAAVPELQDDGVYLITGGLGSMGQAFAQYLVEHTKRATIVLTGRRPEQGSGADEFDLAGLVEREAKLIEQMAVKTLKHYGEFPRLLDEYCASLVLNYWRECGIDVSHGRSYSETELQKKLNLLPVFAKFYRFFVAMLIEDDLLVVENETLTFKDVSIVAESAELRQKLLTGYPQFAGLIHYLSHCAQYYRPALSGEMPAINVLYPDGAANSLQRTEAETVEHRHDRLYLHLTADWLAQLEIETRASRGARPFRVLEVGGGNGNLTLPVVEALAANHGSVEYYFTDVGRSFVNQAREEAAGRGVTFMRFEVLDISVDPIAQGFSAGYFDAIIGYNVVHTVPNVEQALGHLDMLLAPTGVLGLVETVNHRRWDTLVWGLAEGWWYFEEERLTPLIDLNGWRAVVSHRFSDVHTFPEAVNDGDAGLIIGRKKITSRINELAKTSHSQLVYMQADIADRTEMGGIVEQIHAKYGAINGVIHTAGVLGQGLIRQKQRNQVEAVMNAKVTGTKVLSDLLQADPLDFYLLCGSMSSIAPIAGQIDYCAANSYLDAIAHLLRSKGVSATAIDWGFWQALGMIESADMLLADKLAIEHQIESNGWAQAGVAAFERILANGSLTQVVVSPDPVRQGITHPLFDHYYTDERGRAVYVAYLSGEQHWLVDEHRLDDAQVAVVPGTGHLELMRAAYSHATGHAEIEMQDVHFIAPLAVVENEYENGVQEVRIILQNNFIRVVSKSKADLWVEHVQATIKGYQSINRGEAEPSLLNPNTAMQTIAVRQDMVPFGPRWHCLRELAFSQDGGRALLELPAEFWGDLHHYQLHPALLDMATGFLTLSHGLAGSLPFSYGTIEIHKPLPARIISHATLRHEGHATVAFDVTITDEAGALLVQIFDYKLRRIQADPVELAAISAIEEAAPAENFQVGIGTPGLLDTLYFEAATRQAPAAGEVEIEIVAAGLNFIEVLFALGMLPDPGDARFGLECAGRISRVGAGVTQFAIGDEVMAFASGCFARFATVPTKIVAHKPAGVTLAEAATIPAVFTTAYYALVTRGQLTAGEKVLIHSASGGVGMAAVQIAQWIGAEVYATAGSEEKRERVRQLGVKHVSDSRSLAFADEILAATDGYGVDVVLNALGGEFIDKNLELLAYYGRFLEIGKRDVFKSTQLDMRHFSKSLAFLVLDVGPDMPRFNEVWRAVSARFEAEDFRPLPNRMFPMSHAAEAMQFMAQAQHIGKVVLLRDEKIDLTTQVAQLKREPVGLPLAVILGDENNDSRPVQKGQNNPALNPQKLDHTADNKYARPDLGIAYIAPRSDSEQTIANIWQDLLGIAQIGVEDDFFDLRGDSLLAAQVISRIHQKMGTRLPLSALFDTPTIAGLATMLLKSESESKSENNNQADFDFDMEEGEI